MSVTNVIFAGLGGQGVLKGTDILGEVLFEKNFDVKKSEVHGMSQRGGSVSSDVRFGKKVLSPMIPEKSADYLIAVSEDQIDVCKPFINENTVIIRPDDLSEEDRNSKMMNTAMLAKLNQHLKFPQDLWLDLIRENFKGQIAEDNIEVFRKAAQ